MQLGAKINKLLHEEYGEQLGDWMITVRTREGMFMQVTSACRATPEAAVELATKALVDLRVPAMGILPIQSN